MLSIDPKTLKSLINDAIETNKTILTLKEDVATLKEDVHYIKEHQLHLGVTIEEMQRDLKLILEAVVPAQERALKVDNMVNQVNSHEYRLSAVESWIKDRRSQLRD